MEWIETVEDGWNVLAGAKALTGLAGSWGRAPYKETILRTTNDFEPEGAQRDVFGDGKTSVRIVEIIGGLQ